MKRERKEEKRREEERKRAMEEKKLNFDFIKILDVLPRY